MSIQSKQNRGPANTALVGPKAPSYHQFCFVVQCQNGVYKMVCCSTTPRLNVFTSSQKTCPSKSYLIRLIKKSVQQTRHSIYLGQAQFSVLSDKRKIRDTVNKNMLLLVRCIERMTIRETCKGAYTHIMLLIQYVKKYLNNFRELSQIHAYSSRSNNLLAV